MCESAMRPPEQRSTASKSDSCSKSASSSPGHTRRLDQLSWQTTGWSLTLRTRRMNRTGEPASTCSAAATLSGASSTSFWSTRVT